jgi:hypothetical protein
MKTFYNVELILDHAYIAITVDAPPPGDEEDRQEIIDRLIPLACAKFRDYYGFDLEKYVNDADYEYGEL